MPLINVDLSEFDDDDVIEHLKQRGYVVIKDVGSPGKPETEYNELYRAYNTVNTPRIEAWIKQYLNINEYAKDVLS